MDYMQIKLHYKYHHQKQLPHLLFLPMKFDFDHIHRQINPREYVPYMIHCIDHMEYIDLGYIDLKGFTLCFTILNNIL